MNFKNTLLRLMRIPGKLLHNGKEERTVPLERKEEPEPKNKFLFAVKVLVRDWESRDAAAYQ